MLLASQVLGLKSGATMYDYIIVFHILLYTVSDSFKHWEYGKGPLTARGDRNIHRIMKLLKILEKHTPYGNCQTRRGWEKSQKGFPHDVEFSSRRA